MADNDLDNDGDTSLSDAINPPGGEDFVIDEAPKKQTSPAILAALLVAALGGAGYFFYMKQGPAAASAATAAPTKVDDAKKTINEFLSGGGKDLAAMEQMLRNTETVVKQFLAYPSMTQIPLGDLRSNPFRFAPPADVESSAAESLRLKEEAKARAVKAVSALQIESLMTGRNGSGGTAIINGKFVKPGDTVEGFKVDEIRQSSVVVSGDGFRFELKLAR